jgi:hypothetical protein
LEYQFSLSPDAKERFAQTFDLNHSLHLEDIKAELNENIHLWGGTYQDQPGSIIQYALIQHCPPPGNAFQKNIGPCRPGIR